MKEKYPVFFTKKNECCGCTACYCSCPTGAINMEKDIEGFLYPVLNMDKCICCYKCLSVCAFKSDIERKRG